MGLFSPRPQKYEIRPEQKWDYISLTDFKSNSCLAPLAYGYLFFSLLTSLAVYGVDTFTAVNLLAFGKWSGSIEPTQLISFAVTKWIFSICIIASFVNLAFEHFRANRIMRRGSVAECYLDNLAVRLESSRMGKGQGWRRFLVFAELTKSKKGAEYVALFTYFSFQSWIRVIFCSGPRQVVNALTLYAVYTSALIPTDQGSVDKTIMNFFGKLEKLAEEDYQQAVVLSGMLFTLVIWVFGALSLLLAGLFYVFFLWHYIPRQDGGLSGYCERKINKRLMKIVSVKVNKAIEKEERERAKAELRAAKKAGEQLPVGRQATLPTFMDDVKDDKLPDRPMINRNDTMATLPPYTSRPGIPGSIEMNSFDQKRPMPTRQGTSNSLASQSSYSSRAPLLSSAASIGMERPASRAPTLPNVNLDNYPPVRPGAVQFNQGPTLPNVDLNNYFPARPGTAQSNQGPTPPNVEFNNYPPARPGTAQSNRGPTLPNVEFNNYPPARPGTAQSSRGPTLPNVEFNNYPSARPGTAQSNRGPTLPNVDINYLPARTGTAQSNRSFGPGQPMDPTQTSGSSEFGAPSAGFGAYHTSSPSAYSPETMPSLPPPIRSPLGSMDNYNRPMPQTVNPMGGPHRRPTFDDDNASNGRSSPAPSNYSGYSNRGPPSNNGLGNNGPGYNGPGYAPMRSATNPINQMSSPRRQQFQPQRNMTAPMPPRQQEDYFTPPQRPGTSSSPRSVPRPGYGYNNDVESQRRPRY